MDKRKVRLNLDLPKNDNDRLLSLQLCTNASTRTEVIKSALRLYEDVLREQGKGNTLMIKDESGMIYPYRVLVV